MKPPFRDLARRSFEALRPTGPNALLAWLSLAIIVYSAIFVAHYIISPIWSDLWLWVPDFQRWQQGRYTFYDLIKFHSESHRIVTTRPLLILDGALFGMHGIFVAFLNWSLLLASGLLLWRIARRGALTATHWLPCGFWIALAVSTAQWENLVRPFQIQFALTCVSGLGAILLLLRATESPPGPAAIRQALFAVTATIFAIFSMSSGVLLVPALAVLLLLRRARLALWLTTLPLCASAIFLWHWHHDHAEVPALLNWPNTVSRILYSGYFLSSDFTAIPGVAPAGGFIKLALFCALTAACLLPALRKNSALEPATAGLAALGFWILECAPAGTLTPRLLFGPESAFVSRYATMSLLLDAALIGLFLHAAPHHTTLARIPRGIVVAFTAFWLVVLNLPNLQHAAAVYRATVLTNTQLLTGNIAAESAVPSLMGHTVESLRASVRFLHDSGLNDFSPGGVVPHRVLSALRNPLPASLPPCTGYVDQAIAIDESAFLVFGWLADETHRNFPNWAGALDAAGHLLGAERLLWARPDVAAALGAKRDVIGLAGGFRFPSPPPPANADQPRRVRLLGYFDNASPNLCSLGQMAEVGPIDIVPDGVLQDRHKLAFTPTGQPAPSGCSAPKPPDNASPFDTAAKAGAVMIRAAGLPPGRALALPYRSTAEAPRTNLRFQFADGTALYAAIQTYWYKKDWRAVVVPADVMAKHPGDVRMTVQCEPHTTLQFSEPDGVDWQPEWSKIF